MRIKYLSGAKKDSIAELSDDVAKAFIEAGTAEAVVQDDELQVAIAAIGKTIDESVAKASAVMEARLTDRLNKGIGRIKPVISVGADLSLGDPRGGFKNFGEFAQAVRKSVLPGFTPDARLLKMRQVEKADGMSEGVPADGGDLVPVQYANELYRDVLEENVMFQKARKYPITNGNTLIIPVRNTTTLGVTAASGGSLGTWLNADGVVITPQKPVYGRVQMNLNRWGTMLPVTDELLQDNNVALSNFIFDEGAIAMAWDLNEAFIRGTGTAQPTGILQSGALVTVAANDGTNPAISFVDLVNMKSTLYTIIPGNMDGVVWLAHPDCESQFLTLQDGAGRNLYYAAGTLQNQPKAQLFGIPVEYSYHCAALGVTGDIILADMRQFFVSTKANGGVESAMSMHFYFDAAEVAYRLLYRIDGKTARQTPIALPHTNQSRSGFIVLNTRTTSLS